MNWRKRQNKNEKRLRFPCRNSPTLECAVPSLRDISGEKKNPDSGKKSLIRKILWSAPAVHEAFSLRKIWSTAALYEAWSKRITCFFAQILGKKNPGIELLSHTRMCSTIVARPLINRVRDGNVSFKPAIDTGKKYVIKIVVIKYGLRRKQNNQVKTQSWVQRIIYLSSFSSWYSGEYWDKKGGQASRLISIGKLKTLLFLHIRPIEVVVYNLPLETIKVWDISSSRGLGA